MSRAAPSSQPITYGADFRNAGQQQQLARNVYDLSGELQYRIDSRVAHTIRPQPEDLLRRFPDMYSDSQSRSTASHIPEAIQTVSSLRSVHSPSALSNSRSPLQSAGRPEAAIDDDFSPRLPVDNGALLRSRTIGRLGVDGESAWQAETQGEASRQFEVNGRRVSLLKSRSESTLPPDFVVGPYALSADQAMYGGQYRVPFEEEDGRVQEPAEQVVEKTTRFPLLKAKTTPKLSLDSPAGSPSLKVLGRKKLSLTPSNSSSHLLSPLPGGNEVANEVAEAVLGTPSLGNTPVLSRQGTQNNALKSAHSDPDFSLDSYSMDDVRAILRDLE